MHIYHVGSMKSPQSFVSWKKHKGLTIRNNFGCIFSENEVTKATYENNEIDLTHQMKLSFLRV